MTGSSLIIFILLPTQTRHKISNILVALSETRHRSTFAVSVIHPESAAICLVACLYDDLSGCVMSILTAIYLSNVSFKQITKKNLCFFASRPNSPFCDISQELSVGDMSGQKKSFHL